MAFATPPATAMLMEIVRPDMYREPLGRLTPSDRTVYCGA